MPAAFTKITDAPFPVGPGATPYRFDVAQGGRAFVARAVQASQQGEGVVAVAVTAWEVDDQTGAPVLEAGVPVQAPTRVLTIQLDALADGALTVDGEVASAVQAAAERLRNVRAQLAALALVPSL